jgi:hypothetical protein
VVEAQRGSTTDLSGGCVQESLRSRKYLSDAGGTWACKVAWKRKEDTQKHDRFRPKDGEEGKKPIPAKTYTETCLV